MKFKFNLKREPWLDDALCKEIGPELFFPEGDERDVLLMARKACEMCPVKSECLLSALTNDDEHGVWAGTSARGRGDMIRGKKPLPEWADERHEKAIVATREDRRRRGAATEEEDRKAVQILQLTEGGLSAAEIAKILDIHPKTVDRRRKAAGLSLCPTRELKEPTWDPRCGTTAGRRLHGRKQERACDPCRIADAEYKADQRRKDKAA